MAQKPITQALTLAKMGMAVFPCKADKSPFVTWRDGATADLKKVSDWWQRWPNAMIGLPCGEANDLFVVDLDVDKETGASLGEAAIAELGYSALLAGPSVRTPSGGLHLYFRHWLGGRNTVATIAPYVDTRAEGGYVIAQGSKRGAESYQGDIDWHRLPKVPIGLRAKIIPFRNPPARTEAWSSPSELADLLAHIPADCDYRTWLTVLLAIHHKFGGSDEGLALAEAWSAQGAKYRPGEVNAKWRSFVGEGITFASLAKIAKDYGADLSAIARKHSRSSHG